MKKLVFVVIGVIAVIGLLTAFDGDCKEGKNHHNKKQMMNEKISDVCEELELTAAQKEQMEELRTNSKKEMISAESEIKLLEIDKKSALKDKNFKLAKKLTGDIFEIKQEMAEVRIEQQEQRWNILTPEQQAKAEEMREEHPRKNMKNASKLKKQQRKN